MSKKSREISFFDVRKTVCLPELIKQRIQEQAKEEYPMECCGILFGKKEPDGGIGISDYEKAQNDRYSDDRSRHFGIDPLKLYKLERQYLNKGLEIAGFVHSHPDAPAVLSEEDEREMLPGLIYLIVEVKNGECSEFRAWKRESIGCFPEEISGLKLL